MNKLETIMFALVFSCGIGLGMFIGANDCKQNNNLEVSDEH